MRPTQWYPVGVWAVAEHVASVCACCRSETVRPQRHLYGHAPAAHSSGTVSGPMVALQGGEANPRQTSPSTSQYSRVEAHLSARQAQGKLATKFPKNQVSSFQFQVSTKLTTKLATKISKGQISNFKFPLSARLCRADTPSSRRRRRRSTRRAAVAGWRP